MLAQDVVETKPGKQKKAPKTRLAFSLTDLIIFLSVSGILVLVSMIFWIDFLYSIRLLIGAAFASYVNLAGLAIGVILLVFCFLLFIVSRRSWRGIWIVWGVLCFLMVAGIGLSIGIKVAMQDRRDAETIVYTEKATIAFQAGERFLQEGKLELARSQFQYVLQLDPKFPGAFDKLVEVESQLAFQLTPTVTPTITPIPTIDTRNQDEIYNQVLQHMAAKEWGEMLEDLETLRNVNPDYKVIEMDGMYFLALRMRGIELIFGNTQRQLAGGNLEEGIYLLNLAAKFAPLDSYAIQVMDWARLYINAAAYWGINWSEVVNRFAPIAAAFPNMIDINHITAAKRYVEGMVYYADYFAARNDYCNAGTWYQNAYNANLTYNVLNQTVVAEITAEYDYAVLQCWGPTSAPVVETATSTTPLETPTETPTETTSP